MKILDLKMQAFGPFKGEQHIDFTLLNDKGMFLINGPTGSGKTTIFDAIVYALYGKGSGSDREDGKTLRSDFADDETPTYVDLLFSANGNEYRIIRKPSYRRPAKRGDGYTESQATVELYLPGGKVISKSGEVENEIKNKILFMDRNQFKSVALLAQGEFTKLVNASSNDRAKILEHIFQKEIYNKFQDKIEDEFKRIEKEKDGVIVSINTLINQVEDGEQILGYQEALDEPKNIPSFLNNLSEVIKAITLEIKDIKAEENKAEEVYKKSEELLNHLRDKNKQINLYLNSSKELENLENNRLLIENLRKNIEKYDEYLRLKPAYEKLNNSNILLERTTKKIEENNKQLNDIVTNEKYVNENVKKYDESKVAIDKFDAELVLLKSINEDRKKLIKSKENIAREDKEFSDKYKEFLELEKDFQNIRDRFFASTSYNLAKELKDGESCPVCGSKTHPHPATSSDPVSEADFKSAEKNYRSEEKRINEAKNTLESHKLALIESEKQLINKLLSLGISDASSEYIYSNKLDALISEKEAQKEKLSSFVNNYESIRDSVKTKRQSYEQNKKYYSEEKLSLEKQIEEANKELEKLLTECKYIKNSDDYNNLGSFDYKKAVDQVKKYDSDKLRLSTIIENVPDELKNAGLMDESELVIKAKQEKDEFIEINSKRIKVAGKLTSLTKSHDAILKKYKECEEVIERFTSASELFSTSSGRNRLKLSFKMYILADYFEKIIEKANQRLTRITNGRYTLIRRVDIKGGGLQGLDLDVFDIETGKCRAASSMSGGEKFVSALSMALGLSDIIETNHALVQVESIFIDEGFATLDNDFIDTAMKALESLKNDNKVVAIISHVEKLNEYISDGLDVLKVTTGSTIKYKNSY